MDALRINAKKCLHKPAWVLDDGGKMKQSEISIINRASTARMKNLVGNLPDETLLAELPNGWTIAVTLAHLAFWDQKVIYTLDLKLKEPAAAPIYFDDSLNDILAPVLAAISPANAVELALRTAAVLDDQLAGCPLELFEKMDQENHRWVERALHRNEHLNDVEAFLKTH
jgi:hypothetical protein